MNDFTLQMDKGMRELSTNGAFLTVRGNNGTNTMTISWGFMGFMWNKPHFITVVRPQRYTKQLLDSGADSFTISIPFDGQLREELSVCGTKSGRDMDKGQIVHFAPAKTVASPVVEGCGLYYECVISMAQQFDPRQMPPTVRQWYKEDYHFMFFGEIKDCYSLR